MTVALDLGSTRLKAARLTEAGRVVLIDTRPTPPLTGSGLIREGDPEAWVAAASELLAEVSLEQPGTSLAIASQRSTFVLWEKRSGKAVTPMVSWQDRRGEPWCRANANKAPEITARTGLTLSPHYVGPKLAVMLEKEPSLRGGMAAGRILFGTLETYLIWLWSGRRVHRTDLSMAARTLMADLREQRWSEKLLNMYEVPVECLPEIGPTSAMAVVLDNHLTITTSVADQAAGALAVLGERTDTALVNLGTGGFVLRVAPDAEKVPPGFLLGPTRLEDSQIAYAVEGTINAIGPTVEGFGPGPTLQTGIDPAPSGFCVPDSAGLGSPHWRADFTTSFSPQAKRLMMPDLRRVVLEGVVFRVKEILDGFAGPTPITTLLLSGGMTSEPFLGPALADCTGMNVQLLHEPEATLLGAARLGAGQDPYAEPNTEPVSPLSGQYLADKYRRWRGWTATLLHADRGPDTLQK